MAKKIVKKEERYEFEDTDSFIPLIPNKTYKIKCKGFKINRDMPKIF